MGSVLSHSVRRLTLVLLAIIAFSSLCLAEDSTVQLTIHTDKPTHSISPTLYGLFFEDINFGADGGLYAELIRNRSFEFEVGLFSWSKVEERGGKCQIEVLSEKPLNKNNPRYLRLTAQNDDGAVGIANSGYGGIVVQRGKRYLFSVYVRSASASEVGLLIRLQNGDGTVAGQSTIDQVTSGWKKYTAVIEAKASDKNARLVVLAQGKAAVDIDMVSLFPEDTWKNQANGLRSDMVKMLADLEPSFIRFPGGCIVEGKNLANAYRWKDTIGDPAERKTNWNRWSGWNRPPEYYQSYGLGFFEYFRLCEDLGAEPVPVLNCGMSCQFQDAELVPLNELDEYVQDALDLIEYANGSEDSTWGAKRAEAGHPEPFNLKFVGVGNEQWGEQYFERYDIFYKAIKAKYPQIQIITTSGPAPDGQWFELAWTKFRFGTPAEIVDEHYYRPPQWLLRNSTRYDFYDRGGPKVFAGEYAAHNQGRRNNLYAALCEAALMTGFERNSDVVVMSSYAPLFAKIGSTQWTPDLIWFDNTQVYGTPSYYVQKLFSTNCGTVYLRNELNDTIESQSSSVQAGRIGLATWGTIAEFKDLKVVQADKVLFTMQDSSNWQNVSGTWTHDNGQCRQTDIYARAAACFAGQTNWTDYTLSLKARKIEGEEGFIAIFHRDGNNGLQWNLGGWGNSTHAIQLIEGDNSTVLAEQPGWIEMGRWYDIRIELEGFEVRCFLDGKLTQTLTIPTLNVPQLFASSTLDEKAGQVIVKVVNATAQKIPAQIQLAGAEKIDSKASVLILSSSLPEDENTLESPKKVFPVKEVINNAGRDFMFTFKQYSLTVLKLKIV